MLHAGQHAPAFTLPDADMNMLKLSSFKGKNNVVLFFYPRDNTPGCTLEAIDFSDHEADFLRYDTIVLGISRDDCLSHAEFRDRHGLAVNLLADVEGEVCGKYGVWQEKEKDGVKRMGIVRSTFIIDKQGTIRSAMYGVSPKGHVAEVLKLLKEI